MASFLSENVFENDLALLEKIYTYAGYASEHLPVLKMAVAQGDMALESILENAISRVSAMDRVHRYGQDFIDRSDAKKLSSNNNGIIAIPVKNKIGMIRAACIHSKTKEVFFFRIPRKFYYADTIGKDSPKIRFKLKRDKSPIWAYETDFEGLCVPDETCSWQSLQRCHRNNTKAIKHMIAEEERYKEIKHTLYDFGKIR